MPCLLRILSYIDHTSCMSQTNELCLRNARVVLPDQVVSADMRVADGAIIAIESGICPEGEDLQGDYLIPGLVEVHTDHLETHYSPRPGVRWNPVAAIQAHDAQIATAGITTVLDCLRMGTDESADYDAGEMLMLASTLQQAQDQSRLRAEHFLHLRCEVSSSSVLDDCNQFALHDRIKLMSLMDHAPGQRQFTDMAVFEHYHKKKDGMDEATFKSFMNQRLENSRRYSDTHRATIAELCHRAGIPLASHDDATLEHVNDAVTLGVRIAEFPTTLDAACRAHEKGMKVLMGAPNVVRGKSHSGNVGARELAKQGVLDILSSDYIPASLLHSVFVLSLQEQIIDLPEAIALVTKNSANAVGLSDRGILAEGYRADLVRVSYQDDVPTVKCVWRSGIRVV